MITFIRTAAIVPGKGEEAIGFAHKIVKLIADKTGVKVSVSRPVAGNPMRIAWICNFDSMAQSESFWAKLTADTEYKELLVGSAPSVLMPGSNYDEYWAGI